MKDWFYLSGRFQLERKFANMNTSNRFWYTLLHLLRNEDSAKVSSSWRSLQLQHHPDSTIKIFYSILLHG